MNLWAQTKSEHQLNAEPRHSTGLLRRFMELVWLWYHQSNTTSKITVQLSCDLCKLLWAAKTNEWRQKPRPDADRITSKGKSRLHPTATVAFLVENSPCMESSSKQQWTQAERCERQTTKRISQHCVSALRNLRQCLQSHTLFSGSRPACPHHILVWYFCLLPTFTRQGTRCHLNKNNRVSQ